MKITIDITPEFIKLFDPIIKESIARAVKELSVSEKVLTKKQVAGLY